MLAYISWTLRGLCSLKPVQPKGESQQPLVYA